MAGSVNPELQRERNRATFEVNQLTTVLDGGEDVTARRRHVENLALAEDVFVNSPEYHYLTREDKYREAVKKSATLVKNIKEQGLLERRDLNYYLGIAFPSETTPLGLHITMFLPTLMGQSSEEQMAKWLPRAMNFEIIGTYAQTELGHGTHVRGLETTAHFDPKSDEFVIHSPTQTSLKWWPGGMGKTTNYVVCMAVLYTKGKKCGIHPFIVQTRCTDTHQPMPGVTLGDIGPKFGYDTIDNGFLKFDHVRIPRENMLMKNAEVSRDGTFIQKKSNKLSYGAMVFVRAMLVYGVSGKALAQAATIAIRYSAIRRQSELQPGQREPQILDYQTQQYKLFPMMASAYAYLFAGITMRNKYFELNEEIMKGNTERMPELHGLSAGLKSFTTDGMMAGIEQCRLACGGHGYSHVSGIPKIYVHNVPACTYEGENTVMYLQAARYLMKVYPQAESGKKLAGSVAYLSQRSHGKCLIGSELSLDTLAEAYKHRAARLVSGAGQRMSRLLASGKEQWEAWNMSSVEMVRVAKAHAHYYVVQNFVDKVKSLNTHPEVTKVLTQLCQLYACVGIMENAGDFIEDGYMNSQQLECVNQKTLDLLADIRPNAVALVDSFDFRDRHLGSILGRYDGQVYENMYKYALESPLNKDQVHESYYKYLRPMMKAGQSKL